VDSALKQLIASSFNEVNPSLSPDGRWLAYQSDETGRDEVYVRPFPNVNAGKFQVSGAGGTAPRWSHKGDEIFFQTAAQDMVTARVRTMPAFGVVSTTRLFSWLGYFWPYDVSRDDEHFLMLRTSAAAGERDGAAQLIVVENFVAELRRLLP
jgi:serine/threonine-protein kinase